MNAYHLRKSEIEYELKIRNLSSQGSAGELRKRLCQALADNVEADVKVVNSLDVSAELENCEAKLQDLSALTSDYEGTFQDNEYHRIVARLLHLYRRVKRIPETANSDEDNEESKKELLDKTKELIEAFKSHFAAKSQQVTKNLHTMQTDETRTYNKDAFPVNPEQTTNWDSLPENEDVLPFGNQGKTTAGKDRNQYSSVDVHAADRYVQKPRYVPVYKWGISFDNTGMSIAAFLERVEELRRARGVTHQELFESAVDLFSGTALVWYRSSAGRIHSWTQLCKELKEVFQPPDYDFRLQQEIFNRLQGEREPIDLYVAAMEGLYGRLSVNIPEASRLAQIFNNLHPQLQDRLALVDIKTLDDLRSMGRRAEAGRLRQARPRPPINHGTSLEPDLAYQDSSHRRAPLAGRVAAMREQSSVRQFLGKCWNCGRDGHRFMSCKDLRKRFCYGCGKADTLKKDCETCRPKNGQNRESAEQQ